MKMIFYKEFIGLEIPQMFPPLFLQHRYFGNDSYMFQLFEQT